MEDDRGIDLISDALPFGGLWYMKPDDAVAYPTFFSRSHDAVIRVYDDAGKVIETYEHTGVFSKSREFLLASRRTSGKKEFPMIPFFLDSSQVSKRIRRKNSIHISLESLPS